MPDSSASLLSTIRSVLEASPPAVAEPGTLRCHTLFSIPRQVKSLYPLAHIHPHDLEHNKRAASIAAFEEQIFITASWIPSTQSTSNGEVDAQSSKRDEAPLLVLAMELYLYTIPESGAAVLYISKLDSSGYGPRSIPTAMRERLSSVVFDPKHTRFGNTLTATLSSAVTQHFTTFRHWDTADTGKSAISHVSVHILARSQRAYLFPSSPENKDKKVLSDGALIKWWRAVMSDVIVHTRDQDAAVRKAHGVQGDIDARAFYLIPGYSKAESHPLVPLVRQRDSASSGSNGEARSAEEVVREAGWVYGHPYSAAGAACAEKDLPPLPLHWQTSSFSLSGSGGSSKVVEEPDRDGYDPRKVRTVPTLMPHFSDDPKTRFLDEMARDAHEHSGWKKKSFTHGPDVTKEEKQNGIEDHLDITQNADNSEASNKRRADEDGENSSPEKRAKTEDSNDGAGSTGGAGSGVPLVTLRALMRERELMDDLPVDEFWERMAFRQECCAGNAVGVLVILFTRHPSTDSIAGKSPERQPLSIPYKVLGDVVFKSLMKDTCEWNKITHARTLTAAWFQAVDKEVRRKGGVAQFLGHQPQTDALVGDGVIWQDFELRAPTKEQMEKAKNEAEVAQGATPTAAAPANMLSVKRKKKPTA